MVTLGPYSFLWNTSDTNDTLYNIQFGNYSVTVTNIPSGCMYYNNFSIENSGLFTISGVVSPASCSTCNSGSINLSVNGVGVNYTYLWSNGNTTQDITSVLPGNYSVTVTDEWGCIVNESFVVGFYNLINENAVNDYFNVYPNPSNGLFFIEYEFNKMIGNSIEIYDLTGKLTFTQKLTESKGQINVDLQQYPKGLYLIRKINGNKIYSYRVSIN